MRDNEYIYTITHNEHIEEVCRAALNHEIDGSLVLVNVEGSHIEFRNTEFKGRVCICIDGTSDGILFEGCMFRGDGILIKNSGTRVLFENCIFEGGAVFIENSGYEVFHGCRFLPTAKESVLFAGMAGDKIQGSLRYTVVMDSEIIFSGDESMAFVTDMDDKVTLINTKIVGSDKNVVIWTREMANENTFSYYNSPNVLGSDDCGYEISQKGIGAFNLWNLLSGNDEWDPGNIKKKYSDYKKEVFFITASRSISVVAEGDNKALELTYYPCEADFEYEWKTAEFVSVVEKNQEDNRVYLEANGKNNMEEPVFGFITFETCNELKTDCVVEVMPSLIEPPRFLATPVIIIKDGRAYINYEIDLNGREDQSEISWYRVDNIDRTKLVAIKEFTRSNEKNCRKIAVSRRKPCSEITLTPFDIGRHLKVNIKPKHSRSNLGPGLNVMSRIVMASDIKSNNVVLNLENQVLNPYYKTEPGYTTPTGIWFYKRLSGSSHYGIVTESNDCGFYLEGEEKKASMTVYVILDMENNRGEGFNVNGEYQEIYIKYDTVKKCGYGIRYECVDVNKHLAGFSLYKYNGLVSQRISEMEVGSYMASGMDIKLDIKKNDFTAEISVPDSGENIILNTYIEGNDYGGMGIKNNVVSVYNNRISVRHIEIHYEE